MDAEADGRPDREPPARILRAKQARGAPGDRDPAENIKRHIGKKRAGEDHRPPDARRHRSHENCLAFAAQLTRDEPAENSYQANGDRSQKTVSG